MLPHKTAGVSVGHINSFFHSLISLISVGLGETWFTVEEGFFFYS